MSSVKFPAEKTSQHNELEFQKQHQKLQGQEDQRQPKTVTMDDEELERKLRQIQRHPHHENKHHHRHDHLQCPMLLKLHNEQQHFQSVAPTSPGCSREDFKHAQLQISLLQTHHYDYGTHYGFTSTGNSPCRSRSPSRGPNPHAYGEDTTQRSGRAG